MKRRTGKSIDFDTEAFLRHIGAGKTLVPLQKKQVIFSQGDSADAVYYIKKGKVRLFVVSKSGKEATIALMGAGAFIGDKCVATSQPFRLTTASSIFEAAVVTIKKPTMI